MNDDIPLVLIVDDDAALRGSIAFLLASIGLESQSFPDAAAFLDAFPPPAPLRPGALLLDVRMPGLSGLELQRLLRERRFPLPILIITGHGEVPMAVQALKSGAHDFIEKPFQEQALLDAVSAAIRRSIETLARRECERRHLERCARLGRREREVLDSVLAGASNKLIAERMALSVKTVEAYRAAVMSKMEAGSVAELAMRMATAGAGR
ncbi:response regulator transcription factor [Roseateles sp. DAIF2]|uniref:response regulator transcription factor n=1 Tax=Roseateles sp. DAIF2 TaxID=2714952 RepID=UPI0018A30DBD|nr:response regulator [Roseateles sp. DAIF2]QPF74079.1 response regulator transcription factor [Roseateles sp. DAIF2]